MHLMMLQMTNGNTYPCTLRLLQFMHPLGSGKVIHLLKGLDFPQERPHGWIVHRAVLCYTGRSHLYVNCRLCCAPAASGLWQAGGLKRSKGTWFAKRVKVVSRRCGRGRRTARGSWTRDGRWRIVVAARRAAAGRGVVTSTGTWRWRVTLTGVMVWVYGAW